MNHSFDEAAYVDDAERLYQAGYHANSLEECPYPDAAQGPRVIWMQGWHRHQTDRKTIAAAAAHPWCRHPLRAAI